MPDIGPMELILLLAIVLLVFGPGKLPEVGKSVGNAIREFRKATSEVHEATRIDAPAAAPAPVAAQPAAPAPQVATPQVTAAAPPAVPPAPNTLAGSVQVNTLSEPGSDAAPRS